MPRFATFATIALFLVMAFGLAACARPMSGPEFSPRFNEDTRKGVIANEGETTINLVIRDVGGRSMPIIIPPALPIRYNGGRAPSLAVVELPPGVYAVEVETFFIRQIAIWRWPVPVSKYTTSINVPRGWTQEKYGNQWWGWTLVFNEGAVPQGPFPHINVLCNVPFIC